jgi:hypothetical protein
MPVQVNILPLFEQDEASRLVEKLNINFNKLLELGVGSEGPRGIQGPRGAMGPPGVKGDVGRRGSLWYANNGSPVGSPDYDALHNDLYIDIDTGDFYQYKGDPAQWQNIGPVLSNVITNVISNLGLATNTFLRDFYNNASPDVSESDRYIVLKDRTNNQLGDQGDQLILHNFDETTLSQDQVKTIHRSLQSIFVDVTQPGQRYHLEIGGLYNKGTQQGLFTDEVQNFKLHYNYIDSGADSKIETIFDLSKPDLNRGNYNNNDIKEIKEPSRFLFRSANDANYDPNATAGTFSFYIGSRSALQDLSNSIPSRSVTNGIHFHDEVASNHIGTIGFTEDQDDYTSPNAQVDKFVIDTESIQYHKFRLQSVHAEFRQITDGSISLNFNDNVKITEEPANSVLSGTSSTNRSLTIDNNEQRTSFGSLKPGKPYTSSNFTPTYLGDIDQNNEYPFELVSNAILAIKGVSTFVFSKYDGGGTQIPVFNYGINDGTKGVAISKGDSLPRRELDVGGEAIIDNNVGVGRAPSSISDEVIRTDGNIYAQGTVYGRGDNNEFTVDPDIGGPQTLYNIPVNGSIYLYGVDGVSNSADNIFTLKLPDTSNSNNSLLYDGRVIWVKSKNLLRIIKVAQNNSPSTANTDIKISSSNIHNKSTNLTLDHYLFDPNGPSSDESYAHQFMYDAGDDKWIHIQQITIS